MPLGSALHSTLPLADCLAALTAKGVECCESDDPGRFVCNYLFYTSLSMSSASTSQAVQPAAESCSAATGWSSIFVHVPPLNKLPLDQQLTTIRELMLALGTRNCN